MFEIMVYISSPVHIQAHVRSRLPSLMQEEETSGKSDQAAAAAAAAGEATAAAPTPAADA